MNVIHPIYQWHLFCVIYWWNMWIWQRSVNDKELRGISNAGAIHHKCRWFKQLRDLSEWWDMSFNVGGRGESRYQATPWGGHWQRADKPSSLLQSRSERRRLATCEGCHSHDALVDTPTSRGWFLTGAGDYAKSRKTEFCSFREEVVQPRAM